MEPTSNLAEASTQTPDDPAAFHAPDCALERGFACDCGADPCHREGAPCVSVLMPGEECTECGRVAAPEPDSTGSALARTLAEAVR